MTLAMVAQWCFSDERSASPIAGSSAIVTASARIRISSTQF